MPLIQCKACGAMISSQARTCPRCGQPVENVYPQPPYPQPGPVPPSPYPQPGPVPQEEGASTGLKVLSVFIPLAGWILYFVYKDEHRKKASECAKWAWIGFGISFVFGFIGGLLE